MCIKNRIWFTVSSHFGPIHVRVGINAEKVSKNENNSVASNILSDFFVFPLAVHRPPVPANTAREAQEPVREGGRQHRPEGDHPIPGTLRRRTRQLPPDIQGERHLVAQECRIPIPRQGECYLWNAF